MGNIISSPHSDQIYALKIKQDKQSVIIEEQKRLITNIELDRKILRKEILSLRNTLEETTYKASVKIKGDSNDKFNKNLEYFIDNWYEKNNKEIDIGVIADLPFIGEIDILPDKIEKYIYKRSLQITFAALKDVNINFMGNNLSIDIEPINN